MPTCESCVCSRGGKPSRVFYAFDPTVGELEIVARFADHAVKIGNFADLNEKQCA